MDARENFYAGRNINENCHKGRRAMGHFGRISPGLPVN